MDEDRHRRAHPVGEGARPGDAGDVVVTVRG
jgi:hypothetical protein